MARISIHGDGVAARCSALLLRRAGFEVLASAASRARLPVVMLSDAAVALMRDVFARPDLFRGAPRITRRFVRWGTRDTATDAALDHGAVAVSEEDLLAALGAPPEASLGAPAEWSIHASRPLPEGVAEHRFGARSATATPVELTDQAEPSACWMESLEDGWLFLISNAPGRAPGQAWMLSVGPAEELMSRSRLVAPRVARRGTPSGAFPSSPRIAAPLCGPGWLACGTAALTFDPICGDGTANAVREAILAAAVIEAIENGGDAPSLLGHYEARLRAGFRKHLEICLGFYRSGGPGDWWRAEAEALRQGLAFCDAAAAPAAGFRYRLSGFRLEPVECYT